MRTQIKKTLAVAVTAILVGAVGAWATPSATAVGVVSGTQGTAIANQDVTITLAGTVEWILAQVTTNANVDAWFTNLPTGLQARVKTQPATAATPEIVITISGLTQLLSSANMAITIPVTATNHTGGITITPAASARFQIVQAGPATGLPNMTGQTAWMFALFAAAAALCAYVVYTYIPRRKHGQS